MRIPHLKRRSQFYQPVLVSLPTDRSIAFGEIRECVFTTPAPSSLEGEIIVDIVDGPEFDTDWVGNDITWFAARIKAAATALRDAKQYGRFLISHPDGECRLTIKRLEDIESALLTQAQCDSILASEIHLSRGISEHERARRLAVATRVPERMQVISLGFRRNADVIVAVLIRANGLCESCFEKAPFLRRSDGSPYLEVHHRVPLSHGGEDTVENAAALCPNCHRKAHFG